MRRDMIMPSMLWAIAIFFFIPGFLSAPRAQEPAGPLSLQTTIQLALEANLDIKQSQEDVSAARAAKQSRTTDFLPTFGLKYDYLHRNQELTQELTGIAPVEFVVRPQDEYTFTASVRQPIFTGFAIINQYKLASLGLDAAEINAKLARQNVILEAKQAYFSLLKAQKLVQVSKETVRQIKAQRDVAENFYQVGMSPLNDLLQAKVQLANAKQALTSARNNLEVARTQFNIVLRRPVNTPVEVVDILDYKSFEHDLDYCLETARSQRLEIKVADLDVKMAKKEMDLTKKDYFPVVDLSWNYQRVGDEWDTNGGEGITDAHSWNIQATFTWNFWQWGKTHYDVREKLSRLAQARYRRQQILDNINLEVKQAYLRTREAEKNIITVQKAIEQARENLRITQEQYKEQVSTQTDVLVAQTLLTNTMTNYYNALYDYKIAKAALYRSLGQEVME